MGDYTAMVTHRTQLARELRTNATDVERLIWRQVSRSQLGTNFRRQFPLGPYVLDFVSLESRINIELDGSQHFSNSADVERDAFVRSQGFTVLRFWNNDAIENMDGALTSIMRCIKPLGGNAAIKKRDCPSNLLTPPLPSPEKGEGAKKLPRP